MKNWLDVIRFGGATILIGVGIATALVINNNERDEKLSKVEYILDVNKDRKISEQEAKRFYDEMTVIKGGYVNMLNKESTSDLDRFLDKYK